MDYFDLGHDDLMIQVISRKQYDKLKDLYAAHPTTNCQVPLKNGQHGVVVTFFKYREIRFYAKILNNITRTKIFTVKSEGSVVFTTGYWNYQLEKFQVTGGHTDSEINGISSIKSAISFLYNSDYYLIAQITN